jgi:hypothetical protein
LNRGLLHLLPIDWSRIPGAKTGGWVLLIEAEQARVIVALLVSVAFLALHLFIKPLHRCESLRIQPLLACPRRNWLGAHQTIRSSAHTGEKMGY